MDSEDTQREETRRGLPDKPKRTLFSKYLVIFVSLITGMVLVGGLIDLYFSYSANKAGIIRLQQETAASAAARIDNFFSEIIGQLGWLTLDAPWTDDADTEQRRKDALKLLRQVPAITEISELDIAGRERLRISRLMMDKSGGLADYSADPKFTQALRQKVYFGPVYYRRESEPYMVVSMAGLRRSGVVVAEVNLKFIWDVVSRIRIGEAGHAYLIDSGGQLVAHPDISLVLRKTRLSGLTQVRDALGGEQLGDAVARDAAGRRVLTSYAPIAQQGWFVFTELPLDEAFAPLYASLWRTAILLLAGLIVALVVSLLLARRLVGPIRALQQQASRIGQGDFDTPIDIHTNDEIELLGEQINSMATDLRETLSKADRLGRLKRFLSPQIAEIIESSGGEEVLESHRREIAVVFCDLRGFTPFADSAEPEEVMGVLKEYHAALGELIYFFGGTLERFVGDGLMVLFNDPLPCPDPAIRAVRMADAMRTRIAELKQEWQQKGHALDFGVGIAQGFATLGRIGFEGRFDYAAIGNVPNLASRLCDLARGGQILIDQKVYANVRAIVEVEPLGDASLKGLLRSVPVYSILNILEE